MDLRARLTSDALVQEALQVLDYQPFIIRDDIQTGVGFSWLHWPDPREAPPLVFKRADWAESEWNKITSSNQGLRAMYQAFIQVIAQNYPGGSLLDMGCNNGYFPVAGEVAGMRGCAGVDQGDHQGRAIRLLNTALGTGVEYFKRQYSPERRCADPLPRKFDVVSASAILCHLPDPLHFLAYLASLAKEALFFWGQALDTESFVISYSKPHPNLSSFHQFPYDFNDNTRLSVGLLKHSMTSLGFSRWLEIPRESGWIAMPEGPASSLESELSSGSRHRAFLFMR